MMDKLGQRNAELIFRGQRVVGPDPDRVIDYICEDLYVDEYDELHEFLKWSAGPGWSFGPSNYEQAFAEFKRQKGDV